jgi:hypothetical protein
LARQYGNSSDKLFINDYGLENSLAKCDGLIDYVSYIESKGAQVDGIGTQMHLSLSADTSKIAQMFQKLAATGKLIKISEFDIQIVPPLLLLINLHNKQHYINMLWICTENLFQPHNNMALQCGAFLTMPMNIPTGCLTMLPACGIKIIKENTHTKDLPMAWQEEM